MTVLPHRLTGSGPHRVIALHSWLDDRTGFDPLLAHLDTEAFTVAAPDQRGYGEARALRGRWTTAETAADVLALADHLGWPRFSLIGHSMGGKAAQHVLALAPERVTALVGISPVPADGVPFDADTLALFTSAADSATARAAIVDQSTGGLLPRRWVRQFVDHSFACADRDAFAGYLQDWATTDFHEGLTGRTLPVLAVVGRNDPSLSEPLMRATLLRWLPNTTLHVLHDAGHYAPAETPLALLALIETFLAP